MRMKSSTAIQITLTVLALASAARGQNSQPAAAVGPRTTVSLDGPWRIVFDRDNVGHTQDWHKPAVLDDQLGREIPVPSCWEEHEQDYEGVAWYARRIDAPEEWAGRNVRVRFDAVNYLAQMWVNGQVVGEHEGGYGPFEFDLSDHLDYGRANVLTLRVVGPAIVSERVDTLVRNATPHWRGGYVGGIWQSVGIVVTDPVYVADLFIEPRLNQSLAEAHVELANNSINSRGGRLEATVATVRQPDEPVVTKQVEVVVPPGGRRISVTLPIENVTPWSPDNPHLYVARVRLIAKKGTGPICRNGPEGASHKLDLSPFLIDEVDTRFGMRSFTVQDGNFYLNGKRIFIKGAFWEGQYPGTLAHPRDMAIVRKEIEMAKQAGFNMLRPWRMPPVPAIIDLCDEMGMLLSGAPAVENMGYWPEETPQMERRWTDDMVAMVKRDRNHPSIVLWETANEIIRKSNLLPRHRITVAARAADPTRLIIDESGGSRAPWGSHVYLPYSSEPTPMIDRHIYLPAPLNQRDYNHLQTYGEADQGTLISEVGYGGAPDLADNVRRYWENGNPKTPDYRFHVRLLDSLNELMDKHELRELFPDASALCLATQELQADGNKLQLEALRTNPKVDGYCLHAYTAGDWVVGAGVLDIWRQPKLLYQACAEVQAPVYLAIHAEPQNVYAYKGTTLTVTAVNDGAAMEADLAVSVRDESGQTRPLFSKPVDVGNGITSLFEHKLDTTGQCGMLTVTARLTKDATTIVSNSYPLFVLKIDQLKPPAERVALIEPKQRLQSFFKGCGVEAVRFGDGWNATGLVVIAQADAWTEQQLAEFNRLMDWVKSGGTAIWLTPPTNEVYIGQPIYRQPEKNHMMQLRGQTEPWPLRTSRLINEGVFPFKLNSRTARGMWIPVGHYTRNHPIFDGLPTGGFMGHPYQNVVANYTITNLPGKAIAGSVSWDVIRDYRGPTEWWHGADMAVLEYGEGELILSTLRIVENLGRDPVADKLLFNLIKWSTRP
jgi:beta-galactosidase